MIESKKIFLTGGAGFIGLHLVERLIEKNEIVIYDNFRRNTLSQTALSKHPNLKVINGDVLDLDNLEKAMVGSNYVIHMAAVLGVTAVIKKPVETMETNISGCINVLKAASKLKNLDRFVNFSTSEVYGSYSYKFGEGVPTTIGSVGEARWVYALSKLATDHLALSYYTQYGLPALSVRPFNVYGPRRGEAAFYKFIDSALNGKDITVHGDGDQIRSWCFIDDFVDGIILCLENESSVGEVFNLGNPKGTITILNLAEKIKYITDSKSNIVHVEKPYVDIELRIPSIDKSRELLSFNPKISLDEGIRRTIAWYQNNKETPPSSENLIL